MPKRQLHREVFLAHNGVGPWSCFDCGVGVSFEDSFHVHHIDGDDSNNLPANLVAMHPGCHGRLHKRGFTHSPEARILIGLRGRGRRLSQEHKQAISRAHTGKVRTPEELAKASASLKGRVFSEETKGRMSASARRRARSPEGKTQLSEAGKKGAFTRWTAQEVV